MAIDNLPNGSDESRLSGAYIRTLVKQLTTSKSTNTTENFISNDNSSSIIVDDYKQSIPLTSKKGDKLGMAKPSNQQNVQQGAHKKQVRRRLHTSRPYQERLLNMAEARKEIVTALKFHRAAMKQANEQRKQQQLDGLQHHQSIFGGHDYENSNVKHEIINNSELVENYSYYTSNNINININGSSYSWSGVTSPNLVEPPLIYENIPLPNQTLGLNLNLQAFTNLDANLCHGINTSKNNTSSNFNYNNSFSSSLSPSTSSSSTPRDPRGVETMATEEVGPTSEMHNDMHPSLDEEEMAEIRSLGEQHQIEWDDTLNLVKSVWWFKFLKTVDIGKEIKGGEDNYYSDNFNNAHPFGELMDFPPWLSANNDQSFLQQHLDDSCSEDTTLPWMDIGDIDGLDDDWLS